MRKSRKIKKKQGIRKKTVKKNAPKWWHNT